MNIIPLIVAALAILPVVGAAAWVWFAMASAHDDLRSFVGGLRAVCVSEEVEVRYRDAAAGH